MDINQFYQNVLVVDIETVSCKEDFSELPDRLKSLWEHKSTLIKNEEELSAEQLFFKKGAIYAEFGKIVCISVGFFNQLENKEYQLRVTSFASDNEKELLSGFKELVLKFPQKQLKLVAHNGKEFDFPYLCRRMIIHEISLPESLDLTGKKPWEVNHIDTMEMWEFGDRKSYTSLDLLSAIFGIESSKQDMDGSMVNETYYKEKNLEKISTYCMADVMVTAQLYLRLNLLPMIKEENMVIVK